MSSATTFYSEVLIALEQQWSYSPRSLTLAVTREMGPSMASLKHDNTLIPFPPPSGFERKLRRHGALIECRCTRCGFRFIGSITHKLALVEQIHVCECTKKSAPRSAAK